MRGETMDSIHNEPFPPILRDAIAREPKGAQIMIHYPDGSAEFQFNSTDIISYDYIRGLLNSLPITMPTNVIKPWAVPGLGRGNPKIYYYMNFNDQLDKNVPINDFATKLYEEVHPKQKELPLRGVLVMVWPDQ
jgi:hypothetical protein